NEYTTASTLGTVSRITSLMPYKGQLFAFGYHDGPMPQSLIPESSPTNKLRQPNRVGKAVVFDGVGWFPADIIPPTPFVQTIEPCVFANQLLLSVRSGRYREQFKNQWLLFAYDGEKTRPVPLDCEQIVDLSVNGDRLILLLSHQGKYLLAETTDLVHWKRHPLDPNLKQPLSLEHDGTTCYLGLVDGTVLTTPLPAD
ncbi:MAG: hypothetical protein KDA70_17470, partial [Planctomycetaceae bacterium]|nr:hypothetical protein [Planctomycetaceae bacterium]